MWFFHLWCYLGYLGVLVSLNVSPISLFMVFINIIDISILPLNLYGILGLYKVFVSFVIHL